MHSDNMQMRKTISKPGDKLQFMYLVCSRGVRKFGRDLSLANVIVFCFDLNSYLHNISVKTSFMENICSYSYKVKCQIPDYKRKEKKKAECFSVPDAVSSTENLIY